MDSTLVGTIIEAFVSLTKAFVSTGKTAVEAEKQFERLTMCANSTPNHIPNGTRFANMTYHAVAPPPPKLPKQPEIIGIQEHTKRIVKKPDGEENGDREAEV